jgi:hypothetical protein
MRKVRFHGFVCAASALLLASAAWSADSADEQMAGAIEAVIFVCAPIDAKSAKTGLDLLATTTAQHKLDLVAVRKSAAYRSIYNSEANRLLSLPAKERLAACKSAW